MPGMPLAFPASELPLSVSHLVPGRDAIAADVHTAWNDHLSSYGGADRLYQSPLWIEHKIQCPSDDVPIDLTIIRDQSDIPIAVMPTSRTFLDLEIRFRGFQFIRSRLHIRSVLGNLLPIPDDSKLAETALIALADDVDGVSFRMLPCGSAVHNAIIQLVSGDRRFRCLILNDRFARHLIRLPNSFDEYLKQFDAKKRYNLKRQPKMLVKAFGAEVVMKEFSTTESVRSFLAAIEPIVHASWQARVTDDLITLDDHWVREYESLAKRGAFRSYVLYVGDRAVAFCAGLQYDGVYYFDTTAYLPEFAKYSPGSVLILMLIELLISDENRHVNLVSFGYGDHAYKKSFGNTHEEVIEIVLLRSTLRNKLRAMKYQSAKRCIRFMKSLTKLIKR